MSKKTLFLSLLVLLLSTLPLLAADEAYNPNCTGEVTDLTDPQLAASLESADLTQTSDVRVDLSTTDTRVTSADFEVEGPDGFVDRIRVTCTLTCTGSACSMSGCTPRSSGGCTSYNCGLGCVGSCTGRTTELADIIIEN